MADRASLNGRYLWYTSANLYPGNGPDTLIVDLGSSGKKRFIPVREHQVYMLEARALCYYIPVGGADPLPLPFESLTLTDAYERFRLESITCCASMLQALATMNSSLSELNDVVNKLEDIRQQVEQSNIWLEEIAMNTQV